MTTFKFFGKKVRFKDGKISADNETDELILQKLVGCSAGGPEDGDPLINTITRMFGNNSVTDVKYDTPANIIY